MVFAAYEFIQKRAERKGRQAGWRKAWKEGYQEGWKEGQQIERERIRREVDALFSERGVDRLPIEDVLRIVRGNGE